MKELRPYWKELHRFLLDVCADRNFVIHGSRSSLSTGGEVVKWSIVSAKYHYGFPMSGVDGSVYWFENDYRPRSEYEVDEKELGEIILDVRAAMNALLTLDQFLVGGQHTLDALLAMKIRRRAPYGHRTHSHS